MGVWPDASAASTAAILILLTWLLWLRSLLPKAPPSLLAKKTSSVGGLNTGASCAKAKVALDATSWIEGLDPKISKKASSNIWKNGGLVDVGLKNWLKEDVRKEPLAPNTANDFGSMNCTQKISQCLTIRITIITCDWLRGQGKRSASCNIRSLALAICIGGKCPNSNWHGEHHVSLDSGIWLDLRGLLLGPNTSTLCLYTPHNDEGFFVRFRSTSPVGHQAENAG